MALVFSTLAEQPGASTQVARWWCDEWGLPHRHATFDAYVGELAGSQRGELPVHVVAIEDGIVCGAAMLKQRGDAYWLSEMYVASFARGRGIGSRLCGEVCAIAAATGISSLRLQTEARDGGLYAKLGWIGAERIRTESLDVLVMSRELG